MVEPGWRGERATLTWPLISALSKSAEPTIALISPVRGSSATSEPLLTFWPSRSPIPAAHLFLGFLLQLLVQRREDLQTAAIEQLRAVQLLDLAAHGHYKMRRVEQAGAFETLSVVSQLLAPGGVSLLGVTAPCSTIRRSTSAWRALASSGFCNGSWVAGACGKPANSDASARVRSLAGLLKYRREAASMP